MKMLARCLVVVVLLAGPGAAAQSLKRDEVLSALSVAVVSMPRPVTGADGRMHLAYELEVVNASHIFTRIDSVEVLDQDRRTLLRMAGKDLAAMTKLYAGAGDALPPGGSGLVFVDAALAGDAPPPTRLAAQVTITRQATGPDGKPVPWPSDAPVPAQVSFVGAETAVGPGATVIAPPLRGGRWMVTNGCCGSITSHRGAAMAVNGRLRIAQRFAIDWLQLGDDGRVFVGDAGKVSSYRYYGVPIHAVADGTVVNRYDEADEQVPGEAAKGITPASIGGNMIVVDIGNGVFAFYAHMQKGSLRAQVGDRVSAGQVLGLLGNTGNSTAPHLHFQLMDGPSPLNADGLPFVFTRFRGQGRPAPGTEDAMEQGAPAVIDGSWLAGEHTNQMPLDTEIVDFQ